MAKQSDASYKRVKIALTDSGDLVAAVTGRSIRVIALWGVLLGNQTVKLQSGASTDLTGAMSPAANGKIEMGFNQAGWVETAAGEKLNAVLGAATTFAGCLVYQEIKA